MDWKFLNCSLLTRQHSVKIDDYYWAQCLYDCRLFCVWERNILKPQTHRTAVKKTLMYSVHYLYSYILYHLWLYYGVVVMFDGCHNIITMMSWTILTIYWWIINSSLTDWWCVLLISIRCRKGHWPGNQSRSMHPMITSSEHGYILVAHLNTKLMACLHNRVTGFSYKKEPHTRNSISICSKMKLER